MKMTGAFKIRIIPSMNFSVPTGSFNNGITKGAFMDLEKTCRDIYLIPIVVIGLHPDTVLQPM